MAKTKNNRAKYIRLTTREKNIIEAGNYVYTVLEELHPLSSFLEADDPALKAIQIVVRPICRTSSMSH